MLTTEDNPFNPITQFDEWLGFDESKGYFTCEYLARIAKVSPSLSSAEYDDEVERAIDEILSFNVLGNYKKVSS